MGRAGKSLRRTQVNMADRRGGGVRGDSEANVIVISPTRLTTTRIVRFLGAHALMDGDR